MKGNEGQMAKAHGTYPHSVENDPLQITSEKYRSLRRGVSTPGDRHRVGPGASGHPRAGAKTNAGVDSSTPARSWGWRAILARDRRRRNSGANSYCLEDVGR